MSFSGCKVFRDDLSRHKIIKSLNIAWSVGLCSIAHFWVHSELLQVSVFGQIATEDAVLLNAIHSFYF